MTRCLKCGEWYHKTCTNIPILRMIRSSCIMLLLHKFHSIFFDHGPKIGMYEENCAEVEVQ